MLQTDTKEQLRNALMACGFSQVGFTDTLPSRHQSYWRAWTNAGYAGEMLWLSTRRELRTGHLDVPELLDGAKTAIVLAVSYNHPSVVASPDQGIIAKYAQGLDYHRVIRSMTKQGMKVVEAFIPGSVSRAATDSAPIPERELAVRAGIGWQGRHTNVIVPGFGNYIFLSVILTTAVIEPDKPVSQMGNCGACTKCLQVCPTGALVAPNVLDPRRCISYWTIEAKESIPLDIRPLMGNRIFGCDICIDICPWNSLASAEQLTAFNWNPSFGALHLGDLFSNLASDEWFQHTFLGTPVLRTGRAGLRRNVAVAIGNSQDITLKSVLEAGLSDESLMVCEHAQWALLQLMNV
jgi:epoxyqueuosine reductase